jgi:hypothetical protein
LYLTLLVAPCTVTGAGDVARAFTVPVSSAVLVQATEEPDALYARRTDLENVRRAATVWGEELQADPKNFEAAWKLSRAQYWLGTHDVDERRKPALETGVDRARIAIAAAPGRPEGHFWLAANMGGLAESFGLRQGIRYRKPIREALEKVLEIDPAFQQGSADRALGRWYYKVPGLFGGSKKKSEEHLRRSLTYDANSTVSRFFLAETLLELDRDHEARAELRKVIDSPGTPGWEPEDAEWRARAKELLAKMEKSRR